MIATITDIPASTCGHMSVVFDVGTLRLHSSEIIDARPETLDELREQALIVLKHQYLTLRAGPPTKTHAQAMAALVGFKVRV